MKADPVQAGLGITDRAKKGSAPAVRDMEPRAKAAHAQVDRDTGHREKGSARVDRDMVRRAKGSVQVDRDTDHRVKGSVQVDRGMDRRVKAGHALVATGPRVISVHRVKAGRAPKQRSKGRPGKVPREITPRVMQQPEITPHVMQQPEITPREITPRVIPRRAALPRATAMRLKPPTAGSPPAAVRRTAAIVSRKRAVPQRAVVR